MTATAKPAGSQPASQPPGAGRVAFVGAGPGDEGLVTLRAAALLADDSLVVGHQDVVDRVRRLIGPDAEVTDSQALAEDPKLLVKVAKAGRLAVRLYAGDPLLFCHAAGDAQPCIKAGIGIEIVPGVPSATAVPAYAGIPLTSDGQGDLRVIHLSEVSKVTEGPGSLVVLGAEAGLADLGKMLKKKK